MRTTSPISTIALSLLLAACGILEDAPGATWEPSSEVPSVFPITYRGTAVRTNYFCLSDCPSCDSTDQVVATLKADNTVELTSTGSCLKRGAACITETDQCTYIFTGTHTAMVHIDDASGDLRCTGAATFDADQLVFEEIFCQEEDGHPGLRLKPGVLRSK